jgi:hypothetical protein
MEPGWVTSLVLEKLPSDGPGRPPVTVPEAEGPDLEVEMPGAEDSSPGVDEAPGAGNADPDVSEILGTGGAEPDVNEIFGNAVEVSLPTFEREDDGLRVPGVTGGADKGG